jgi:hypothetical protein
MGAQPPEPPASASAQRRRPQDRAVDALLLFVVLVVPVVWIGVLVILADRLLSALV